MEITIRTERPGEASIIRAVVEAAFQFNAHSDGTEGAIVDALRQAGVLTVSLVATLGDEAGDEVVGHVAFSPITIDGAQVGWFGLGPVAVRPDLHRRGIGQALIREGLARLAEAGAKGCVVLGNPNYYQRFGFANDPGLRLEGFPAEYFMRLSLDGAVPTGTVAYHEGFSAS